MTFKVAYISNEDPRQDYIFKKDFSTLEDALKYAAAINASISNAHIEIVSTTKPAYGKHEVSNN